jgi:multidrug efflux pump
MAIGTGVLGGVITATVLAVFLVPLFFVMVGRVFDVGPRRRGASQPTTMEGSH